MTDQPTSIDHQVLPTYIQITQWLGPEWAITDKYNFTLNNVPCKPWPHYPWQSDSTGPVLHLWDNSASTLVKVRKPKGGLSMSAWAMWFGWIARRASVNLKAYLEHVEWVPTPAHGQPRPLTEHENPERVPAITLNYERLDQQSFEPLYQSLQSRTPVSFNAHVTTGSGYVTTGSGGYPTGGSSKVAGGAVGAGAGAGVVVGVSCGVVVGVSCGVGTGGRTFTAGMLGDGKTLDPRPTTIRDRVAFLKRKPVCWFRFCSNKAVENPHLKGEFQFKSLVHGAIELCEDHWLMPLGELEQLEQPTGFADNQTTVEFEARVEIAGRLLDPSKKHKWVSPESEHARLDALLAEQALTGGPGDGIAAFLLERWPSTPWQFRNHCEEILQDQLSRGGGQDCQAARNLIANSQKINRERADRELEMNRRRFVYEQSQLRDQNAKARDPKRAGDPQVAPGPIISRFELPPAQRAIRKTYRSGS